MREWMSALRPQYWIVALFPLLIGMGFHGSLPSGLILSLAIVIWGPLFSGATYLLNQVYDWELDKENPRTRNLPIAKGIISRDAALTGSVCLFGIGFLLALWIRPEFAVFYSIGVIMSVSYSVPLLKLRVNAPSTRLKEHSIVGVVVNGIGYGIITLYAGWILTHRVLTLTPLLLGVPLALAIGAGYVYKTVEDIDIDEQFNTRTMAVKLGKIRSLKLSCILMLSAYGILFVNVLAGWISPFFLMLMPITLIASLVFVQVLNSQSKSSVRQNGWKLSVCLVATFILIFIIIRI